MRIAIIIVIILALVTPAVAEMSGKEFKAQMKDSEMVPYVKLYLHGIGCGIGWVNSSLEQDNQKPYFCPPRNLIITEDDEVQMLNEYIDDHPEAAKYPIGLLLLQAYRSAFPCKN